MAAEKGKGTYNAVIIGAGTAGLVTAAGTAGLGGRVVVRNILMPFQALRQKFDASVVPWSTYTSPYGYGFHHPHCAPGIARNFRGRDAVMMEKAMIPIIVAFKS